MHTRTWFGLGALTTVFVLSSGACSDTTNTDPNLQGGICGNSIREASEECDDGNLVAGDGCHQCQVVQCGDGEVGPGEECDDANEIDDDACSNTCTNTSVSLCGNSTQDDGEECDDGNDINDDGCSNACKLPFCGDGIVQAGEDCDDGNNEVGDECPSDCKNGGTGGTGGEGGCMGSTVIFADVVTGNTAATLQSGSGVGSLWAFGGEVGIQAGDDMCAAVGADHICTFEEVEDARTAGEFDTPANQTKLGIDASTMMTFWVHRLTDATIDPATGELDPTGTLSPHGPGGRCNDWNYDTGHLSRGEALQMGVDGGGNATFTYNLDLDTNYDDSIQSNNPYVCTGGGFGVGSTACGGACQGNGTLRGIMCCYSACQ